MSLTATKLSRLFRMTIRKRDFQKVVLEVKEFISKLAGYDTAELRDALNFSLLHLHKYYKKLRHKAKNYPVLDGSISLTSSLGSFSPVSPFIPPVDKFDWRWINLDASKLSASFGQGDKTNLLPEIFYVIKDADVEQFHELIKKDGDCVNEVDALGRSTALYCVHGNTKEHIQCLKILMKHGVDLNQEANDGLTCLHVAAITNDEEIIDILINENVNINVEDSEGRYPLHFAAGFASSNCVEKLLDAGADKNCLDNDEMTPVMWASHFDQCESVELLLNISDNDEMKYEAIDAELQDKDINGQSILHWSVSRSHNIRCFKLLFSSNYANITDDTGKTVLHTIAEKGNLIALEEYLSICEEPSFEVLDNKDRSPLHFACMFGHGEMVDILLNRGASAQMIDKHGHTPFDYAQSKNLNYCMLVLLSHQKYRSQFAVNEKQQQQHQQHQQQQQQRQPTSKNKVQPKQPRSTQKPTENATDILKPPSPSHRTSDLSQFDTPQDEATHFDTLQEGDNFVTDVDHDNGKIDLKKDQIEDKKPTRMKPSDATGIFKEDKKEPPTSIDFDKEDEFNFNDQMIVLVEHHGSDDEVVIDVDGLEEDSSEKDEDLLDLPPFARNGSITTVGVVSEGSMAFNSVSVNPSVSSLVSSEDSDDDRGKAKNMRNRSPNTDVTQHDRNSGKKPKSSNIAPRGAISPSLSNYSAYNVTAPVPPPSQYYAMNSRAHSPQVLAFHPSESTDKPKRSANKRQPKEEQRPPKLHPNEQRPPKLYPNEQRPLPSPSPSLLNQSWPALDTNDRQSSPRSKLAPIHSMPRPPTRGKED